MKKILLINACVRPTSRSYQLALKVLERLDGELEEVNLEKENIQPLTYETLKARGEFEKAKDFRDPMFRYVKQFAQADEIVIAAPYWELSFPAMLRIYFEIITVNGVSFKYGETGDTIGLCKAKRITYVTTSGGYIGDFNLGYDFIKAMAEQFYGICETRCYSAEGLDIKGADVESIMAKTMAEIK